MKESAEKIILLIEKKNWVLQTDERILHRFQRSARTYEGKSAADTRTLGNKHWTYSLLSV